MAKSNHPWMDPVLWKIQSVSVQQNTSVFGCEAAELGKAEIQETWEIHETTEGVVGQSSKYASEPVCSLGLCAFS